jgi:hypothetical protein
VAGIVIVIGTTSTTGYVTTAVMLLFMLFRQFRVGARGSAPAIAIISFFAITIACAFLLTNAGYSLLSDVLLDKAHSGSSLHRVATIVRSLDTFKATYGLGAGLGSDRAMSMAAYILSNLGAAGVIMFGWLMLSLITMSRLVQSAVPIRGAVSTEGHPPIWPRALGMAFAAHILALTESGAEISDPVLWLLWGILLVSIRQQWPALPASSSVLYASHTACLDPI